MEVFLEVLALVALISFSALYSGSEIGFYSLSSVQVDLDAESGSRRAKVMQWLLRNEAALLVTILIGNNLALELATHVAEALTAHWLGIAGAGPASAIVVTLVLTPLVFIFGEALPKDVFRQRPHALTGLSAPLIALSRVVFWPLERMLRLVTLTLEKVLGLEYIPVAPLAGREAVLGFLAEGRRHGALSESAEALANNALQLKSVPVSEAMVPWDSVEVLHVDQGQEEHMQTILGSRYSRLPVVDPRAVRPPGSQGGDPGDPKEPSPESPAAGPESGRKSGPKSGPKSEPRSEPRSEPKSEPKSGPGPIRQWQVKGYVHQLEVLHDKAQREARQRSSGGTSEGPSPAPPNGAQPGIPQGDPSGAMGPGSCEVFRKVRPLLELDAAESIGAALGKFRASGRRIGLVVEGEAVLGVVSVNDLLDRISGVVVA